MFNRTDPYAGLGASALSNAALGALQANAYGAASNVQAAKEEAFLEMVTRRLTDANDGLVKIQGELHDFLLRTHSVPPSAAPTDPAAQVAHSTHALRIGELLDAFQNRVAVLEHHIVHLRQIG